MTLSAHRMSDRIEHIDPNAEQPVFFDLSEGGVCCLVKKNYAIGATVSVRVGDMIVEARVAHRTERTDGIRTGLQFINLTEPQRERIHALVEEYSRGVPLCCGIEEDKGS